MIKLLVKIILNGSVISNILTGCCPADDAEGTPYGPGNACCCGKIFLDNGAKFCCEDNCTILDNTKEKLKYTSCHIKL